MAYEPQKYVYQSDLGAETASAPSSWVLKNKRWLILGGGILVALIVILVIVFFVNRGRANRAADEAARTAAIEQAQTVFDSTKNPEKCAATVQPNLAQETGQTSYCNGLVGDAYDNCVGLAALAAKSVEGCKLIENKEKEDACLNTVTVVLASEEGTYESCDTIANATEKSRCRGSWTLRQMIAGNCTKPMTGAECSDGAALKAAIDARNPELCAKVQDENMRAICEEIVGPGDLDLDGLNANNERQRGTSDTLSDTDGDGLSDPDEVNIHHTNPLSADSDSDGYSDGTEIQSGYNPLG